MENKKVSDEQLNQLRLIHSQYEEITKRYGELAYEMEAVRLAMHEIEQHRLSAIQLVHNEVGIEGQVDLSTGEFIPN